MHSSLSVFSIEAEELPFNAPRTNGYFSFVPMDILVLFPPYRNSLTVPQCNGRGCLGEQWDLHRLCPLLKLQLQWQTRLHMAAAYALKRHWQKNCCACGIWSLSPISSSVSSSFTFPNLPHLSHLNVVFWTVSAPAVNTFGFPSLIHQHHSFLHVLYSHLLFLFFVGSACWAEREERILCYQSSEKGRGANWWWRGMYHGGKEGPCSCLGKSISHTSLLHVPDKGKKKPHGDSSTADWVF